eukprot:jgi/Galph1/1237/GphlegSOOS_G5938.1
MVVGIEFQQVPGLTYFKELIDSSSEKFLLSQIYSQSQQNWTQLANRRLQNWGGIPQHRGMLATPLPKWLHSLTETLFENGFFPKIPNHVLINEYFPGQGIYPHEDGPLYYPCAAILSLESCVVMDFYQKIESSVDSEVVRKYVASVLLEPRSLLLIRNQAYNDYLHGIEETCTLHVGPQLLNWNSDECEKVERTRRVSLTIRLVPRTFNAAIRLRPS